VVKIKTVFLTLILLLGVLARYWHNVARKCSYLLASRAILQPGRLQEIAALNVSTSVESGEGISSPGRNRKEEMAAPPLFANTVQ